LGQGRAEILGPGLAVFTDMKCLIFIVLFLTAGCSLRSRDLEGGEVNQGCETPGVGASVHNLPAGISPSQINVVVKDELGNEIPMTRLSSSDAQFNGTGVVGRDYTGYIYLNGALTSKRIDIGFAFAYCDYNASYDYQTEQSLTAI